MEEITSSSSLTSWVLAYNDQYGETGTGIHKTASRFNLCCIFCKQNLNIQIVPPLSYMSISICMKIA